MSEEASPSMQAMLARIDERTAATAKRMEVIDGKIDSMSDKFVPRTEIDTREAALVQRVANLEGNQTWLVRWVVAAWLAGLGSVGTLGTLLAKKMGAA